MPTHATRSNVMLGTGLPVAGIVLLADQLSKLAILRHFQDPAVTDRILEVAPVLNLVLLGNRGVSFGMFNGGGALSTWLLSALAIGIVAVLLVWLARARSVWLALAMGLIIGGAIGNLVDRLRLGSVVDFLDFHWGALHFYVFNVADASICVGVGLLLLDSLLGRAESPK